MTDSTAQNSDPVNVSIYGKTIPVLFGATKLLCAPIWAAQLVDPGDGSGDRILTAFYMLGGRAPLAQAVKLYKVWIDNVQQYDSTSGVNPSLQFDFYDGSTNQGAPPEIAASVGADSAPGFRGRMCIMIKNYRIPVGADFPQVTCLVEQLYSAGTKRYVTPYISGAGYFLSGMQEIYYRQDQGILGIATSAGEIALFDTTGKTLIAKNVVEHTTDYTASNHIKSVGNLDPYGTQYLVGFGASFSASQLRAYDAYSGKLLAAYGYDGDAHGVDFGTASDIDVQYIQRIATATGTYKTADYWVITTGISGAVQVFKKGYQGGPLTMAQTFLSDWTGFGLTNSGACIATVDLSPIAPKQNCFLAFVSSKDRVVQITVTDGSTSSAGGPAINSPNDPSGATSSVHAQALVDLAASQPVSFTYGVLAGVHVADLWYAIPAGAVIAARQPQGYSTKKPVTLKAYTSCWTVFDLTQHPQPGVVSESIVGIWVSKDGSRATILTRCNFAGNVENTRVIICSTILSAVTTGRFNSDAGNASNGYGGLPSPVTEAGGVNYQGNSVFKIVSDTLAPGGFLDAHVYALMQVPEGQTQFLYGAGGATLGFTLLDLKDGTSISYDAGQYINTNDNSIYNPAFGGLHNGPAIYDADNQVAYYIFGLTDAPGEVLFNAGSGSKPSMPLSTLVAAMGILANFDPADIQTNNLDTILIAGAILDTQVDFLTLMAQIAQLFCVDIVETEGKLKFNGSVKGLAFTLARTLTDDDFAPPDQFSSDDGTIFNKERADTSSLPTILKVDYLDSNNDFQVGEQQAKRTQFPYKTSAGLSIPVVSVPVAMDAATALYWVSFALFEAWGGALTIDGLLTREQLALEPGDYIELATANDGIFIVKLTAVTLNQDWSMSFTARTIAQEAPTTDVIPDPSATIVGSTGNAAQDYNVAYVENIAVLPYAAGQPANMGAITVISDGPVDSYVYVTPSTYVLNQTSGGAIFGVIQNDHPAQVNYEGSDDITPIILRITSDAGVPALSVTDASYLAGGTPALIGAPGRWELIFYRDFYVNPDNTVTLAHVLRGRRGSDAAMLQQRKGDTFIALPNADMSISYYPIPAALPVYITATSQATGGTTKPKGATLALTGGSLKPWSPVEVLATRSGSDVVLSWKRRDRAETDLVDSTDVVPMSEATEAYDLEIMSSDGTSVLRTVSALTAPTYTYTAAQIATDGLTGANTINVRPYQLSAVVGRGYTRMTACPLI